MKRKAKKKSKNQTFIAKQAEGEEITENNCWDYLNTAICERKSINSEGLNFKFAHGKEKQKLKIEKKKIKIKIWWAFPLGDLQNGSDDWRQASFAVPGLI